MRIEALPSPSEHIPTLLERVRPVYLSRTYGLPLPEVDDATKEARWDPEIFLDKLARLKGRLLKGGEPDVEGVAKIVLSDWVRGRIPFFVDPPARPTPLKEKETPKDVKGTAKAMEQRASSKNEVTVKPVRLDGIIQKNCFVGEDLQTLESEEEAGSSDIDERADDEAGSSEPGEHEGEDELVWADVFPKNEEILTDNAVFSKGTRRRDFGQC